MILWEQDKALGREVNYCLIDDIMENKAQEKFIIIIPVLLGSVFYFN